MSVGDQKILKTEPLSGEDAKWTRLILTTYTDPTGKIRAWEHAERPTRPKGSEIDGVGIVAILSKSGGSEIVLQKQYRPPIDKVVIEVPAGLVDKGESAEEAAVRELREETGYVGAASLSTPVLFNDPGFCNTNLKMIHVTIDMEDERNQHPKQELEKNEFIEVFSVPVGELWERCKSWEGEGFAIDARVGTLAEGIYLAKQLGS
ncbi:NUDIX hydrolase domain-like protein [Calycina marina]|uniref:NUDIX hydrolase domain-like protein n=1 Tax=Calycina marina TaxID=1763456 RepID=A0A9P7YVC3_9HELO|nr:NUDIX hydrolase domain-like protein [Calycina marina]